MQRENIPLVCLEVLCIWYITSFLVSFKSESSFCYMDYHYQLVRSERTKLTTFCTNSSINFIDLNTFDKLVNWTPPFIWRLNLSQTKIHALFSTSYIHNFTSYVWKIQQRIYIKGKYYPGQLIQINGSKSTPFWKQLLSNIHNLEMNLHLLVKRWCQKGYYKG